MRFLALLLSALGCFSSQQTQSHLPNIVLIVADDLGIGDVKAYNPTFGAIETPLIDQMMKDGVFFSDAHSTSSVCSPSRYSLLTGRYNWRTRLREGVLHGLSDALIPPDRTTIASVLKKAGYTTACIGKWHVGMSMTGNQGDALVPTESVWNNFDFGAPIQGGPTSVGFDSYYGISASLDMPPYMFIGELHPPSFVPTNPPLQRTSTFSIQPYRRKR
jgi:arylsulfatase A